MSKANNIDPIYEELQQMMPTSTALGKEYDLLMPTETVHTINLPYACYPKQGKGSKITDLDGNEFIDLTMGFGPLLLGHSPQVVVDAVKNAADIGILFGIANPYQGELAKLLIDSSACAEQAAFFNSGTEATMYAIRLARAYSGKTKVAVFTGSYHGAHDYASVIPDLSVNPKEPGNQGKGLGVPDKTMEQMVYLPYRDSHAFDLIEKNKDQLACVFIEPIQSSDPRTDVGPYLKELRDVCDRAGVLLVFDEVITGFRLGFGGGQAYFGVTPDLATYGKILGGGAPVGAVTGPKKIMELFRYKGDSNCIFAGGTFSGNPLSMIAGTAVLQHLKDNPDLYTQLNEKSHRFTSSVNEFLASEKIPVTLKAADSMFVFDFGHGDPEIENLFYSYLLKRGVIIPGIHLFFLSMAHSDSDVDFVLEAIYGAFHDVSSEFSQ